MAATPTHTPCHTVGSPSPPVTADVRKMGARESVFMLRAHSRTSSSLRTRKGFFFTPGFFRMEASVCTTVEHFVRYSSFL